MEAPRQRDRSSSLRRDRTCAQSRRCRSGVDPRRHETRARVVLGHERAVNVIHVLGALAVGEERVEDHDGPTVHHEADLAPEEAVQPRRGRRALA